MRRISLTLVLVAAFGCAGAEEQPDAGTPGDAGSSDVTPGFECCPVDETPTCDCRHFGGSVPTGQLDGCPQTCDARPGGEEETVDGHGCRKLIPNLESCLEGLDCRYYGRSDEQVCTQLVRECGTFRVRDCGSDRQIESCGTCEAETGCFGGKCLPASETDEQLCARLDYRCGQVQGEDAAGGSRTIECGSCGEGLGCNPTTHRCE